MRDPIHLQKILIAVEDSPYSDEAAAYGFSLAGRLDAEVALLHVNEIPVATPFMSDPMSSEPAVILPEMMKIQEDASEKLLARMKEMGKQLKIRMFQKMGNPKDEIIATADEWHADMIILGTHGRTGLDHFIAGSVAEGIVRRSRCPILIIPRKKAS